MEGGLFENDALLTFSSGSDDTEGEFSLSDFTPAAEDLRGIFDHGDDGQDGEPLPKSLKMSLQSDVSYISLGDRLGGQFTSNVIKQRLNVLLLVYRAIYRLKAREDLSERSKQKALKSRLQAHAPPLSTAAKLAVNAVVRSTLVLIQSAQKSDRSVVCQILDQGADLLDTLEPLSLRDGPDFSPDIEEGLLPLVEFIRSLLLTGEEGYEPDASAFNQSSTVVNIDPASPVENARASSGSEYRSIHPRHESMDSRDSSRTIRLERVNDMVHRRHERSKAMAVLFGLAMARGSLQELLSLVDVLLPASVDSKEATTEESFAVGNFLATLMGYKDQSEHDVSIVSIKTCDGLFLSADSSGVISCSKTATEAQGRFLMERHGDKVAFKSGYDTYISAGLDGRVKLLGVSAENAFGVSTSELFQLVENPNQSGTAKGTVGLLSSRNMFVSCTNKKVSLAHHLLSSESFTVIKYGASGKGDVIGSYAEQYESKKREGEKAAARRQYDLLDAPPVLTTQVQFHMPVDIASTNKPPSRRQNSSATSPLAMPRSPTSPGSGVASVQAKHTSQIPCSLTAFVVLNQLDRLSAKYGPRSNKEGEREDLVKSNRKQKHEEKSTGDSSASNRRASGSKNGNSVGNTDSSSSSGPGSGSSGSAPPVSSDSSSSAGEESVLPVLHAPLCVDVKERTFVLLSSILQKTTSLLMTPHDTEGQRLGEISILSPFNGGTVVSPSDQWRIALASILLSTLRVLKVHVHQLTRAKLPASEFKLESSEVISLRNLVFELLNRTIQMPSNIDGVASNMGAKVQAEAAEVLAAGFEFFYPQPADQLLYLEQLLSREDSNGSEPTESTHTRGEDREEQKQPFQKDGCGEGLSTAEDSLLDTLTTRFSSLSSGFQLMKQLSGRRTSSRAAKTKTALQRVFEGMMKRCVDTSIKTLETLKHGSVESLPRSVEGCMSIMKNLQKVILSHCSVAQPTLEPTAGTSESSSSKRGLRSHVDDVLLKYADILFDASVRVLRHADSCVDECSSTDDVLSATRSVLDKGLIGQITRPFITALILLCDASKPWLIISLLSKVTLFAREFESFMTTLEARHPSLSSRTIEVEKVRTVESSHPYKNGLDKDVVIKITGARSLTVRFDTDYCETDKKEDYVQLFSNKDKKEEVSPKYFGSKVGDESDDGKSNGNWPLEAVEVTGDTVVVAFHSQAHGSAWGYRMSVVGKTSIRPHAWMEDMASSAVWLAGSYCRWILTPAPIIASAQVDIESSSMEVTWDSTLSKEEVDPKSRRWLLSRLFRNGLSQRSPLYRTLHPSLKLSDAHVEMPESSFDTPDTESHDVLRALAFVGSSTIQDLETKMEDSTTSMLATTFNQPPAPSQDALAKAQIAIDYLEKVSRDGHMVQQSIRDLSNHARNCVFATILHHTNRTEQLMEFINARYEKEAWAGDDSPTDPSSPSLGAHHRSVLSQPEVVLVPQELISAWKKAADVKIDVRTLKAQDDSDLLEFMINLTARTFFLLDLNSSFVNEPSPLTDEDRDARPEDARESDELVLERTLSKRSRAALASTAALESANRRSSLPNPPALLKKKTSVWNISHLHQHAAPPQAAVEAMKTLKDLMLLRTRLARVHDDPASVLMRDVFEFLTGKTRDVKLSALSGAVVSQRSRAVQRLIALNVFSELCSSLKKPEAIREVLRHLASAFCYRRAATKAELKNGVKTRIVGKCHFLDNLQSAGPSLRQKISERFFKLVSSLMSQQQSLDNIAQLYLIDICNINFVATDLVFLQRIGIISFLSPLVSFARSNPVVLGKPNVVADMKQFGSLRMGPWNLRYTAWTLFRLISYMCSTLREGDLIDDNHAVIRGNLELQQNIFRLIYEQLSLLKEMTTFGSKKKSNAGAVAASIHKKAGNSAGPPYKKSTDRGEASRGDREEEKAELDHGEDDEAKNNNNNGDSVSMDDIGISMVASRGEFGDAEVDLPEPDWERESEHFLQGADANQDEDWAPKNQPICSWICNRCTFLNRFSDSACQVCKLPFLQSERLRPPLTTSVSKAEVASSSILCFQHESDFDKNGIVYHLGTNGGTTAWKNPMDLGKIRVSASTVKGDSEPLSAVVGRTCVRCVTESLPNQWMLIEFVDLYVIPTAYSLKHYSSFDVEALRNWRFEASNDCKTWFVIMNHELDASLDKKGGTKTWTLDNAPKDRGFKYFRLYQHGPNSNSNNYLACSGFEIYGYLLTSSDPEQVSIPSSVGKWHLATLPPEVTGNETLADATNVSQYAPSTLYSYPTTAVAGDTQYWMTGPGELFATTMKAHDVGDPIAVHLPPLPVRLYGYAYTILGASLFVFGGVSQEARCSKEVYRFNIPTSKWERVECQGTVPAMAFSSIVALRDTLVVTGGVTLVSAPYYMETDLYALDVQTFTWHRVESRGSWTRRTSPFMSQLFEPPHYGPNLFNFEDRLFILGSSSIENNAMPTSPRKVAHLDILSEFSFDRVPEEGRKYSGEWTQHSLVSDTGADSSSPEKTVLPSLRSDTGIAVAGATGYMFGGVNYGSKRPMADLHALDLVRLKWTKIDLDKRSRLSGDSTSKPTPRYGHAVGISQGVLITLGGVSEGSPDCLDVFVLPVEEYVNEAEAWSHREEVAHLEDASVDWYSWNFKDVGSNGMPFSSLEEPSIGEMNFYSNQFLWILLRCGRSPVVKDILSQYDFSRLLADLVNSECEVTRVLAVRALRLFMGQVNPASLSSSISPSLANDIEPLEQSANSGDSQPKEATGDTTSAKKLLRDTLYRIGVPSLVHRGFVSSGEVQANDGDGNTQGGKKDAAGHRVDSFTTVTELVWLYRSLLSSESAEWSSLANEVLQEYITVKCFQSISVELLGPRRKASSPRLSISLFTDESQTKFAPAVYDSLSRFVGVLAVLGGDALMVREGSRVTVDYNSEQAVGTVTKIALCTSKDSNVEETQYSVHLETGEDVVVTDLAKLLPVSDVKVPIKDLANPDNLVQTLLQVLRQHKAPALCTENKNRSEKSLLFIEIRRRMMKVIATLVEDVDYTQRFLREEVASVISSLALSVIPRFRDLKDSNTVDLESRLAAYDSFVASLDVDATYRDFPADVDSSISGINGTTGGATMPPSMLKKQNKNNKKAASSAGDGIISFLGTCFGHEKEWSKQSLKVHMTVKSSSDESVVDTETLDLCAPASAGADSTDRNSDSSQKYLSCSTSEDSEDVSVEFWFREASIRPTHYFFRHPDGVEDSFPRNWIFEGCVNVDRDQWITLKEHSNDLSISKAGKGHLWPLRYSDHTFSRFRIRLKGPNSSHTFRFVACGLELYGRITNVCNLTLPMHGSSSMDSVRSSPSSPILRKVVRRLTSFTRASYASDSEEEDNIEDEDTPQFVVRDKQPMDPRMMVQPSPLYTMGQGQYGLLGLGTTGHSSTPTMIPKSSFNEHNVVHVASFGTHVVACTEDGKVFTWGNGGEGRLGHGDMKDCSSPTLVKGLEKEFVVSVAAGTAFSMVLTENGHVFTWGKGNEGQLGTGIIKASQSLPVRVKDDLESIRVGSIGAGAFHAVVLTADSAHGDMYTWGRNTRGQLGTNTVDNCSQPVKVKREYFDGQKVIHALGGWDHTMAITEDGSLYTWGNGYEGTRPVTGHGHLNNVLTPAKVKALAGKVVVHVACGWDHCMAVTKDGHLFTWGGNPSGALGNGSTSESRIPTRVTLGGLEAERVVACDGGQNHTVAVTDKGEIWSWGASGAHCGHAQKQQRTKPFKVDNKVTGVLWSTVCCGDKTTLLRSCKLPRLVPSTPAIAYSYQAREMVDSSGRLPPYPSVALLAGPPDSYFHGFSLSGRLAAIDKWNDPSCLTLLDMPGWRFYPGCESPGNDLRCAALPGNIPELLSIANASPEVKAFNTLGWMKSEVKPRREWVKSAELKPNQGLFVKRDDHKLLPLKFLFTSGGEDGPEYSASNLVNDDDTMYCTADARNVDVLFQCIPAGSTANDALPCPVTPTTIVIRKPSNCTHPIKVGAVFMLDSPLDIAKTAKFNGFSLVQYNEYMEKRSGDRVDEDEILPICFFEANKMDEAFPVQSYRTSPYILLKLISSAMDPENPVNIDMKYFGVYGFEDTVSAEMLEEMRLDEEHLQEQHREMEAARRQARLVDFVTESDAIAHVVGGPVMFSNTDGLEMPSLNGIEVMIAADRPRLQPHDKATTIMLRVKINTEAVREEETTLISCLNPHSPMCGYALTMSKDLMSFVLQIFGNETDAEHIEFSADDLKDGQWHTVAVVANRETDDEDTLARLTAYLDGELVEKLDIPIASHVNIKESMPIDDMQLIIADRLRGTVRDVVMWDTALNADLLDRAYKSGFNFVADDRNSDKALTESCFHFTPESDSIPKVMCVTPGELYMPEVELHADMDKEASEKKRRRAKKKRNKKKGVVKSPSSGAHQRGMSSASSTRRSVESLPPITEMDADSDTGGVEEVKEEHKSAPLGSVVSSTSINEQSYNGVPSALIDSRRDSLASVRSVPPHVNSSFLSGDSDDEDDEDRAPVGRVVSLPPGSVLSIERTVAPLSKGKWGKSHLNDYVLILDFMITELPEVDMALIRTNDDIEDEDDEPQGPSASRSPSTVSIRADGTPGLLGKWSSKRSHKVVPNKWHRLALCVKLYNKQIHLYMDGTLVVRKTGGSLGVDGPASISEWFWILNQEEVLEPAYSNTDREALGETRMQAPVLIRTVHLRNHVFPVEMSRFRQFGKLGFDVKAEIGADRIDTNSLELTGYSPVWISKAMKACRGLRSLANLWIMRHESQLVREDQIEEDRENARILSRMGYPLPDCITAMINVKADFESKGMDTSRVTDLFPHAISWLLEHSSVDDADAASDTTKGKGGVGSGRSAQDDEKLSLPTDGVPGYVGENPAFRVLNSTSEPLEQKTEDILGDKGTAERIVNFDIRLPYLGEILGTAAGTPSVKSIAIGGRNAVLREKSLTEDALTVMYARQIVLHLFQHHEHSDAVTSSMSVEAFAQAAVGTPFLGQFIRLLEFSQIPGGMGIMQKAIEAVLHQERDNILAILVREAGSSRAVNTMSLPYPEFMKAAPISHQLIQEVLAHMLLLIKSPAKQEITNEELALKRANPSLVLWILSTFIELATQQPRANTLARTISMQSMRAMEDSSGYPTKSYSSSNLASAAAVPKSSSKTSILSAAPNPFGSDSAPTVLNVLAEKLFCQQVLNLLLEVIVASEESAERLAFVRIMARLVSLRIPFDLEKVSVLKRLMVKIHPQQQQAGHFSPFMQALIELNLALERLKVEKREAARKLQQQQQQQGAFSLPGSAGSPILSSFGGRFGPMGGSNAMAGTALSRQNSLRSLMDAEAGNEVNREFIYQSDFDTNGIIYYLGSQGGTAAWTNPADLGAVEITSTELATNSLSTASFIGREVVRCVTRNVASAFFCVDLKTHTVRPTKYTLRHYSSWDTEALRNWRFEASLDGSSWQLLREHSADTALNGRGSSSTWDIPTSVSGAFRYFRILQTGPNSNQNLYLACSGFELYGTLDPVDEFEDGNEDLYDLEDEEVYSSETDSEEEETYDCDREFVHVSPMDSNGILFFLGTQGNTEAWQNPALRGHVEVTYSSLNDSSQPVTSIVGREAVRIVSTEAENQWFAVDFKGRAICPSMYTLRHYSSYDVEALRSWRFEGSNDGLSWTLLREHVNDASLNLRGQSFTWSIPPTTKRYSMFRVFMTGPNSNEHLYLALSGFEIYGTMDVSEFGDAPQQRLWWDASCAPKMLLSTSDPNLEHPDTAILDGGSGQWSAVKGAQEATAGKHVYRFIIRSTPPTPNSWKLVVGVVPATFKADGIYRCVGSSNGGWGYVSGNGYKYARLHGINAQAYGEPFTAGDVIDCHVDLDSGTIRFIKNGEDQGVMATNVQGPIWPAVSMTARGMSVVLQSVKPSAKKKKKRTTPSLGRRNTKSSSSSDDPRWFKNVKLVHDVTRSVLCGSPLPLAFARDVWKTFCATKTEKEYLERNGTPPLHVDANLAREIPFSDVDLANRLPEFYSMCSVFDLQTDMQIVKAVNRTVAKTGRVPEAMVQFEASTRDLLHYKLIEHIDRRLLDLRFLVLRELNKRIVLVLHLVDFSLPSRRSVFTDAVRAIRGLIFWNSKKTLWEKALSSTSNEATEVPLTLDRSKASKLVDEKKTDWRGKRALFSQSFQQLNKESPSMWRIRANERAFKVTMVGEYGDDYGGPYRAALESMCKELQSSVLPLFIACPNAREQVGMNRDKFVPRPSATRPMHMAMYEFIGKLMGLAMRTSNYLNLNLPSMVWKFLVAEPITGDDVNAIDVLSFKILEQIKAIESQAQMSPSLFSDYLDLDFTTIGSDQQTYPLVENGEEKEVTWENREVFASSLRSFRVHEFDKQNAAIRRGMATVVPYRLLSLFTWKELEMQVCGYNEVDIDLLQANTVYEQCTANDPHVGLFWRLMRERFDAEERQKFLSFVWGRSRLPLTSDGFDRPFKIVRMFKADQEPDKYMPISHTCFFSIELPKYSTLDVMHEKILYAITHCVAIDADDTTVARAAARRTASIESDDEDEDEAAADNPSMNGILTSPLAGGPGHGIHSVDLYQQDEEEEEEEEEDDHENLAVGDLELDVEDLEDSECELTASPFH